MIRARNSRYRIKDKIQNMFYNTKSKIKKIFYNLKNYYVYKKISI